MTVTSPSLQSGPYVADGVNRVWPYAFRVDSVTDIRVRLTPVGGQPVDVAVGFTATGVGTANAQGIITYPSSGPALAAGTAVSIRRSVAITQPARIGNEGDFLPETHEKALDRATMISQELAQRIDDLGDPFVGANPSAYVPATGGGIWTGASPTILARDRLYSKADLRDWSGLDLTGANDSAATVQLAFNASGDEGFELRVPAGLITVGSTIACANAPKIRGAGQVKTMDGKAYPFARNIGTMFQLAHPGVGFSITNKFGCRLEKFSTYRQQPTPGTGWAPGSYDWDFRSDTSMVELRDIHMMNPSRGIVTYLAGYGQNNLTNISGQPFNEGYWCREAYDVCRLRGIHFWPYWSEHPAVTAYTKNSLTAFRSSRNDGGDWDSLFSIFCRWGAIFDNAAGVGPTYRLRCRNLYADICTETMAILPEVNGAILHFENLIGFCNIASGAEVPAPSHNVIVDGTNNTATFHNLEGGLCRYGMLQVKGSGNTVFVDNIQVAGYDLAGTGTPAAIRETGNALMVSRAAKEPSTYTTTAPLLSPGIQTLSYITTT